MNKLKLWFARKMLMLKMAKKIIQWLSKSNEFEQTVCEIEDDIANQDNSLANFITSKYKESCRGEATAITYDEFLK